MKRTIDAVFKRGRRTARSKLHPSSLRPIGFHTSQGSGEIDDIDVTVATEIGGDQDGKMTSTGDN